MDWKLIFQLSLFGLAMAFATVFFVPPNVEPVVWLGIFFYCAYVIVRSRTTGRFAHAVLLGLLNSVWITGAHILFFDRYIAGHAQEAALMTNMPASLSPKVAMAVTGPVVGLVSGVLIGLLALMLGRVVRPREAGPSRMAA